MTNPCDRFAIVELEGTGHRFWYVSLLIGWLSENQPSSNIFLVTTQSAQDRPEWEEFIRRHICSQRLDVVLVAGHTEALEAIVAILQAAETRLIIPDGDRWIGRLLMATIMRRVRPCGSILIMRPYRGSKFSEALNHLVKLSIIRLLATHAPTLRVLRLASNGTSGSDQGWVNDPVEFQPKDVSRETWYGIHGLPVERRYLVILGDLSQRKFVPELIEAFDRPSSSNWHLMLVGTIGADVGYLAGRSTPSRVSLLEGFICDEDFDTWVDQADAIAVLHRNEGASGILGKCAAAGTPVLVGGARTVLDSARSLGMSRAELSKVDTRTICDALVSIPHREPKSSQRQKAADCDVFAARMICN